MKHFLCLSFAILFNGSDGAVKTWQADSNYDNPNNWSPTRTPCINDFVEFDREKEAVVYLTTKTAFKEMILPMNAEFIFGTNAELGLTELEGRCDGSVIKYKAADARDWHDPENWSVQSEHLMNYDLTTPSPVPHAERVPCESDNVVFPPESSFRVGIQVDSLKVQSITINEQVMDSESLEAIKQQPLFKTKGKTKFELQNFTCGDLTGCACSNTRPEIMARICANAGPQCAVLECVDPVQPEGHCCPICGSVMKMDYGEGFQLPVLTSLFQTFMAMEEYEKVTAYMSKTASNKIQVVLIDFLQSRGSAAAFINTISTVLNDDAKTIKLYSVINIESKSTHQWRKIEPSALSDGMAAGSVIGMLLGIFCVIFLIAGLVILYKRHKISGFTFARFDAEIGKVELELGTTPHDALDPVGADVSVEEMLKGFDNPMYGSSSQKASAKGKDEQKSRDLSENPIYKDKEEGMSSSEEDGDH